MIVFLLKSPFQRVTFAFCLFPFAFDVERHFFSWRLQSLTKKIIPPYDFLKAKYILNI